MTVRAQTHTKESILHDITHAMNEHDALMERAGIEQASRQDRLTALRDITEGVVSDIDRYGEPLPGRLKGAIAEYLRWLEAA